MKLTTRYLNFFWLQWTIEIRGKNEYPTDLTLEDYFYLSKTTQSREQESLTSFHFTLDSINPSILSILLEVQNNYFKRYHLGLPWWFNGQ